MKKSLFIALFGMLFLVACSSQNKTKEATVEEPATEQVQESEEAVSEEAAIDESGEAVTEEAAEEAPAEAETAGQE